MDSTKCSTQQLIKLIGINFSRRNSNEYINSQLTIKITKIIKTKRIETRFKKMLKINFRWAISIKFD